MKSNMFGILFSVVTLLTWSLSAMENVDEVSLHSAAAKGDLESVELLLDKSQNNAKQSWTVWAFGGVQAIDEQNSEGKTALHCAALAGRDEVVTVLLDRGAQTDLQDNSKRTALHCAALAGSDEVVTVLLDRGAQVDVLDDNGDTPLHCAACNDKVEVARLLLERGAQANMLKAFTLLLKQKVQNDSDNNKGQNKEQRPLLGIFSQEEILKVFCKLKPVSERKLKPKEEELTFQKVIEAGRKALKSADERTFESKEHELMFRQISMMENRGNQSE